MKLYKHLVHIMVVVFKVKNLVELRVVEEEVLDTTVVVVEMVVHPVVMVLVVEDLVTTILDLTGQELQQAPLEALTPLVVQVTATIQVVVLEVDLLVVLVELILVIMVVMVQLMLVLLFRHYPFQILHFNQLMQLHPLLHQPQI